MLFDATLPPIELTAIPEIARAAEALGFDGLWSTETMHDPFMPGVIIAEHTSRVQFGTAIAVAFSRSPATMAYTAWDLAQASKGRFILGLGTQVKAHIEKRFGASWPVSVVGKLREQIRAIRSFWRCWQTGQPLNHQGNYYRLTLMTPFFNPGPSGYPNIPIYIAGVNRGLARLAGETADGFLVHPFHTSRYLSEVLTPEIEAGFKKTGRERSQISISATVFTVMSREEDLHVRTQIGFYGSTPSYRSVMSFHGWEDTAEELTTLVRQGKWEKLPGAISDEILDNFAVVASPEALGERINQRYGKLVDRLGIYLPFSPSERDGFWRRLADEVKASHAAY